MKMYRHGDLLIKEIKDFPKEVISQNKNVLAYGEATGHKHELVTLENEPINVYIDHDKKYFEATQKAYLKHQEHETIEIDVGRYVVIHEREFDPFESIVRRVVD